MIIDATGTHEISRVEDRARRVARDLLGTRLSLRGARVALLAEPGAGFVAAFDGVLRAGGCAVVLSPLHAPAESRYFIEDSGAEAVLVSRALLARAEADLGAKASLRALEDVTEGLTEDVTEGAAPLPAPSADEPALQLYTSGTTGKPKGAVLTHGNLAFLRSSLRESWGLRPSDTLLHVLPLHHMHGLCIALLSALGAGSSVRFVAQFDAARVWEEMGLSTVFMAVPTIYAKLLAAFDAAPGETRSRWGANARALRLSTSGSAALPVGLAERWRGIAGLVPLERFGMTELGVALSNPLREERRAGTVGLPLPGVTARIADERGLDAAEGELWIAGPGVFAGYHGREDATREAFSEHEGTRYFRTGDTVARDQAGYFRILGRTSVDIIKSGGYKLSALEIEESLREHEAVGEVAVVGMPDETWGERVVACVVARPGAAPLDEAGLREFAKERMAAYKVPKQVFFLRELPRNALGKVLKPELKKTLEKTGARRDPLL